MILRSIYKMTDTIARLRIGKLVFETMVDLDSAMKLKKGESVDISDVIKDTAVYTDLKKGRRAGNDDLMNSFETTDFNTVVERIVKKGHLEVTQEFRDESVENRKKQIIDFLRKNAIDSRSGRPFTPDIIESAIKQSGVKIEDKSVDKQISNILDKLRTIIPIKISSLFVFIHCPVLDQSHIIILYLITYICDYYVL